MHGHSGFAWGGRDSGPFLLSALPGWINLGQLPIIDYVREENRIPRDRSVAGSCGKMTRRFRLGTPVGTRSPGNTMERPTARPGDLSFLQRWVLRFARWSNSLGRTVTHSEILMEAAAEKSRFHEFGLVFRQDRSDSSPERHQTVFLGALRSLRALRF